MARRVAVELRRVQALDACHSALVLAFVLDADVVLEDVNALGQVVDVEVRGRVAGHVVIPEAVLILVLAEHVGGLGAAAALVLHVDVLHIAIGAEHEAHDEFVTGLESAADGF